MVDGSNWRKNKLETEHKVRKQWKNVGINEEEEIGEKLKTMVGQWRD